MVFTYNLAYKHRYQNEKKNKKQNIPKCTFCEYLQSVWCLKPKNKTMYIVHRQKDNTNKCTVMYKTETIFKETIFYKIYRNTK